MTVDVRALIAKADEAANAAAARAVALASIEIVDDEAGPIRVASAGGAGTVESLEGSARPGTPALSREDTE